MIPAISHALEYRIQTIALAGDTASGGPGGGDVTFIDFGAPAINDAGDIVFLGRTSINASGKVNGIYRYRGGGLDALAFNGQAAVDTTANDLVIQFLMRTSLSQFTLGAGGDVALRGRASLGDASVSEAIFHLSDNGISAIAIENYAAPGSGGLSFGQFFQDPVVNSSGAIAFDAGILDGRGRIFRTHEDSLQLVATDNSSANTPPGLAPLSFYGPVLSDIGQVGMGAYGGICVQDGGESVCDERFRRSAVLIASDGGLQQIASTGDIAPGSGGGGADVEFIALSAPQMNGSGDLLFQAITQANTAGGDNGLFRTSGGSVEAVAFAGQLAPGSGGMDGVDARFVSFDLPKFNDSGDIAFLAATEPNADGGDFGVFVAGAGAVAFEGQPVPERGVVFTRFLNLSLSSSGQVAFRAWADPSAQNQGVFATIDGELHTVAFTGDSIEVAPGDFRTIGGGRFGPFSTPGRLNGGPDFLNKHGDVVFYTQFTDGSSGVFLATLVPEPSAVRSVLTTLMLLAAVGSKFAGRSGGSHPSR